MATGSITQTAQAFQSAYRGTRRIGTQSRLAQPSQTKSPFGQTVTVFKQLTYQAPQRLVAKPETSAKLPVTSTPEISAEDRKQAALKLWKKDEALAEIDNADYEARRMIGDTATVVHLDYKPTAAMTQRWEAYGSAYGVRFILSLWQEDIDFINAVTGAGIGKADFTPAKALELVVKRIDSKRGMTGAMAVFHKGSAVFTSEAAYYQTPATAKFQAPVKVAPSLTWPESPFKPAGKAE